MNNDIQRRGFLTRSMGIAAFSALSGPKTALAVEELKRIRGTKIKIALNSYSFNRPLTAGKMTLDDVIDYCALHDIDGVDTTGYYFPGYPKVPTDEYIYNLKKKAYLNGVTINGTGVRNDFTLPDASKRQGEVQLVKDWIEVARKLGANVIRVFSGRELPKGYTFDQVLEWMIPAFKGVRRLRKAARRHCRTATPRRLSEDRGADHQSRKGRQFRLVQCHSGRRKFAPRRPL